MALLAAVAFNGGHHLMKRHSMVVVENELNRGNEWQRSIVALAFYGGGSGQQ
jgi:hypothetical protein